MLELCRRDIGAHTLTVVVTERLDGDQRPDLDRSSAGTMARVDRQRALTGLGWSMVAEEHGVAVVDVDVTGEDPSALPPGDVLVTTRGSRALSIWAGDCAPLVLCGAKGTLVAAHAGWRGLAAGVVDVAVGELTCRDDTVIVAVLGPCIHAECYEFGADDLATVAAGVGARVNEIEGSTRCGGRSLDVPAAVGAALRRRGIGLDVVGACTSCDERWFSHRARVEEGRHAVVAWTSVSGADHGGRTPS